MGVSKELDIPFVLEFRGFLFGLPGNSGPESVNDVIDRSAPDRTWQSRGFAGKLGRGLLPIVDDGETTNVDSSTLRQY